MGRHRETQRDRDSRHIEQVCSIVQVWLLAMQLRVAAYFVNSNTCVRLRGMFSYVESSGPADGIESLTHGSIPL